MKGLSLSGLAALLLAGAALAAEMPTRREGDLKVGHTAPVFTISDLKGETTVKLADLKGRPVVLIFGSCT